MNQGDDGHEWALPVFTLNLDVRTAPLLVHYAA
jgi:hypothetical protein